MREQADLAITAAVAVLTCVAAILGAPIPVTAVLGIVLLAGPGYLLGQLLFGSRIAGLERLAVFTGLALCVPILGGLALAAAGLALHRTAWLGLLAGTTLVSDLILFFRRRSGRVASFSWRQEGKGLPTRHVVTLGVALAIVIAALGLARAGAALQSYPGFTQLWLAHPNANAATANLGVGNYEGRTTRYLLVLLRNGHEVASWNLTLANGQSWHQSPVFSAHIAANLYKLPDVVHRYRYVTIGSDGGASS
jgi:hypothetical protein